MEAHLHLQQYSLLSLTTYKMLHPPFPDTPLPFISPSHSPLPLYIPLPDPPYPLTQHNTYHPHRVVTLALLTVLACAGHHGLVPWYHCMCVRVPERTIRYCAPIGQGLLGKASYSLNGNYRGRSGHCPHSRLLRQKISILLFGNLYHKTRKSYCISIREKNIFLHLTENFLR